MSSDNKKPSPLCELSTLTVLSPVDGRYAEVTTCLRGLFSEFALFHYRVRVEVEWLKALAACAEFPQVTLSRAQCNHLDNIVRDFTPQQAQRIKQIEQRTHHDVKAVEYYLRERFASDAKLKDHTKLRAFIHFACTSDDINNLAWGLMINDARQNVLQPAIDELVDALEENARVWSAVPMISRTHGQAASPTTVGKEFKVFAERCKRCASDFATVRLCGKMNGASGNLNAHHVVCPHVDWLQLCEAFVESLGLENNRYTTQLESGDATAALLHAISRFNTVLLDLDRDMWGYISLNYFRSRVIKDEIGSSVMPHKVNPIDFENSEGNAGLANALAIHLAAHLPLSRWQRDLSNSTAMRNIGLVFAHTLLAVRGAVKGLARLHLNEQALAHDLEAHPQVLTEAIQTVMRLHGLEDGYEQLATLSRGRCALRLQDVHDFIKALQLPEEEKRRLLQLRPRTYLGLAAHLATSSACTTPSRPAHAPSD